MFGLTPQVAANLANAAGEAQAQEQQQKAEQKATFWGGIGTGLLSTFLGFGSPSGGNQVQAEKPYEPKDDGNTVLILGATFAMVAIIVVIAYLATNKK